MRYVRPTSSEEVVYAKDLMSARKEALTEMRADEPGTACYEYPLLHCQFLL